MFVGFQNVWFNGLQDVFFVGFQNVWFDYKKSESHEHFLVIQKINSGDVMHGMSKIRD